jgi:hypothetical protein
VDNWVKRGPVAVVAGFLFPVALVLVTQHGGVREFGWVFLAFDIIVLLLCVEPIQRRLPWKFVSRKELTEDFWQQAFEALPFPAFVKEFPKDRHVKDNHALTLFQGEKPEEAFAGADLAALIQQDHQYGDSIAVQEGLSVQLELTDKVTSRNPRPILTLKSRIEYDHRTFVIGCYVPVSLPSRLPSGPSFEVAECGGQVIFSCPTTAAGGSNNLLVKIGNSLRRPQAESRD